MSPGRTVAYRINWDACASANRSTPAPILSAFCSRAGHLVPAADGGRRAQLLAFGIYGATLLLLYGASTCYRLPLGAAGLRRLRTLDHIAIYFLIAGTYTPVAAITLRESGGRPRPPGRELDHRRGRHPVQDPVAGCPGLGLHRTYLGMGYLALVAAALAREVGAGMGWLVAGGVAYTVGAIIYAVERLDPLPGRFGHHGLWHLLVLAGSACHFTFIVLHVASI